MFSNVTDVSLWPCLHPTHAVRIISWNLPCLLCRIGGTILLIISTFCFIFNIRYFIRCRKKQHQNALVLSLFLASSLILVSTVPGILPQLFTCQRHCNDIYCRLEGFSSYLSGTLCMLVYMLLSINRYILLCEYNQPLFCTYSAITCWILSIGWTLPPVFGYWTSYTPEGLGFHCSIDWNNHSHTSHFYIILSFIGIYLIPLIILFIVNLRVNQIVRNIYSYQNMNSISPNIQQHSCCKEFDYDSHITVFFIRKAADRKRLRTQYRFIQAIIFLVSAYLFAWTPYSIIAILQIFHIKFIFQYGYFITLSAFIAKLSVILSPFVYLSIMNNRSLKELFFIKSKRTI
ncbi:unnamed protein product [Adineta steineri]|uniref:G-protein coupled receptors family 1 profile domain-containing protein n=1 Tax=Adineta steineri TaxID=433720 RepID=A0A814VZP0_9BILA|nr:unnamed protein product [Adineta steineri]